MDDVSSQKAIDFIFANYCTGSREQEEENDDDDDGMDESVIETYLEFVSNITSEFDNKAFAMLKYYFIVTRAVPPSRNTHIPFPCVITKTCVIKQTLRTTLFLQTF